MYSITAGIKLLERFATIEQPYQECAREFVVAINELSDIQSGYLHKILCDIARLICKGGKTRIILGNDLDIAAFKAVVPGSLFDIQCNSRNGQVVFT